MMTMALSLDFHVTFLFEALVGAITAVSVSLSPSIIETVVLLSVTFVTLNTISSSLQEKMRRIEKMNKSGMKYLVFIQLFF